MSGLQYAMPADLVRVRRLVDSSMLCIVQLSGRQQPCLQVSWTGMEGCPLLAYYLNYIAQERILRRYTNLI